MKNKIFNLQRKHKESCKENEKLKRLLATQKSECIALKNELQDRDKLIEVIKLYIHNLCYNGNIYIQTK